MGHKSKSKDRKKEHKQKKHRSRSRDKKKSHKHQKKQSKSKSPVKVNIIPEANQIPIIAVVAEVPPQVIVVEVEKEEENQQEVMMKLFGFSSFGSSKGKDHTDCAIEAVYKGGQVKRKYRQYMNRKGGFNKPLDKMI